MTKQSHHLSKIDLRKTAQKWQKKLNVKANRIQIRKLTNKWGSHSSKGNITLSSKLTELPMELVDYTILHELLHLAEPNHGKAFKASLSAYMPNWQELNSKLVRFSEENEGEIVEVYDPSREE